MMDITIRIGSRNIVDRRKSNTFDCSWERCHGESSNLFLPLVEFQQIDRFAGIEGTENNSMTRRMEADECDGVRIVQR